MHIHPDGRDFMLAHLTRKPLETSEQTILMQRAKDFVLSVANPFAIVVFGSAARNEMTDFSDLDLAVIFQTIDEVNLARNQGIFKLSANLGWPCDLLLYDLATFRSRSEVGGVCQVIREDGLLLMSQGSLYDAKK
jgi:predicted nucleotidyltransferase